MTGRTRSHDEPGTSESPGKNPTAHRTSTSTSSSPQRRISKTLSGRLDGTKSRPVTRKAYKTETETQYSETSTAAISPEYKKQVVAGALIQLRGMQEEAERQAKAARQRGSIWTSVNYLLGVPAAALAAISAATGLATATGRIPAAIIALASAGVAAVAAFLNGSKRAQEYSRLAADWSNLLNEIMLCINMDVPAVRVHPDPNQGSWLRWRVDNLNTCEAALRSGKSLPPVSVLSAEKLQSD